MGLTVFDSVGFSRELEDDSIVFEPVTIRAVNEDFNFPNNLLCCGNVLIEDCNCNIDMSTAMFIKGEFVIKNCEGNIKLPKHFIVEGNLVIQSEKTTFDCPTGETLFCKNVFISGDNLYHQHGTITTTKTV